MTFSCLGGTRRCRIQRRRDPLIATSSALSVVDVQGNETLQEMHVLGFAIPQGQSSGCLLSLLVIQAIVRLGFVTACSFRLTRSSGDGELLRCRAKGTVSFVSFLSCCLLTSEATYFCQDHSPHDTSPWAALDSVSMSRQWEVISGMLGYSAKESPVGRPQTSRSTSTGLLAVSYQ